MDIPHSIKILSQYYTVKEMERTDAVRDTALGRCDTSKKLITIDPHWNVRGSALSLLHEILHAIYNEMNINNEDEEGIVTGYANGIAVVMNDNPELFPYFQKIFNQKEK